MRSKSKTNDLYDNDDPYYYLRYKRSNELICRVDRYSINRNWIDDNKEHTELLFYPSEFGFQQIEQMSNSIMEQQASGFKRRVEQLIKYGNADWKKIVYQKVPPFGMVRETRKLKCQNVFTRPLRKLKLSKEKKGEKL